MFIRGRKQLKYTACNRVGNIDCLYHAAVICILGHEDPPISTLLKKSIETVIVCAVHHREPIV